MPCPHPLSAWRGQGGQITFDRSQAFVDQPVPIPCGQCINCRIDKAREWTLRCVHEAQLHERNSFVTLTYDDRHLPADRSLDIKVWQQFAKQLRRKLGPFRYLAAGEYAPKNLRPHYHACIFGHDFAFDRVFLKRAKGNSDNIYVSSCLSRLWPNGFSTVGALNYTTAAYTASYIVEKQTGPKAETQYQRLDAKTGEIYSVKPEFLTMSRRPGLGAAYFEKWKDEITRHDSVRHDGKNYKTPSFYVNQLDNELQKQIKLRRKQRALKNLLTPDQKYAREQINLSKRKLKTKTL